MGSHSIKYDLYEISALSPTKTFETTIAGTIEKSYRTYGGGTQRLVIDRTKWSVPTKIKTIIPKL